jgi:predicted nucleic acid-binding protein
MAEIFADTWYWVAITSDDDPWAHQVERLSARIRRDTIVTTEEVLAEYLGFVAGWRAHLRERATSIARRTFREAAVVVVRQSYESFLRGLELYERRADKGYSLVDCISMVTMRDRGITQVLSGDAHFRQEGFETLIDPGGGP